MTAQKDLLLLAQERLNHELQRLASDHGDIINPQVIEGLVNRMAHDFLLEGLIAKAVGPIGGQEHAKFMAGVTQRVADGVAHMYDQAVIQREDVERQRREAVLLQGVAPVLPAS